MLFYRRVPLSVSVGISLIIILLIYRGRCARSVPARPSGDHFERVPDGRDNSQSP